MMCGLKNVYLLLAVYKYLIIICLLKTINGLPESPCPDNFCYQYNEDRNLYGLVTVPTSNDYGGMVRLHVELLVTDFNESSKQDVEMLNPLSEVMDDLSHCRPLRYKLYFPFSMDEPPEVTNISVNGNQICSGYPLSSSEDVSTKFQLQHSLILPGHHKTKKKSRPHSNRSTHKPTRKPSSYKLIRPNRAASNNYNSNPFLNPNNEFNFRRRPITNDEMFSGTSNYHGSRPHHPINIQDNPFLSNYRPIITTRPHVSDTLEHSKPNFENNPFLSHYMNNGRLNTTTNKPYYNNVIPHNRPISHNSPHRPDFKHNPFLSGYFDNEDADIPIPNKFKPNEDKIDEATQIPKKDASTTRFSTTTTKPTTATRITKTTTTRPTTTTAVPIKSSTVNSVNILQKPRPFSSECGITVNPNTLVMNGNPVKRGVYPWLTAIFLQNDDGLKFICGSTLISKKHVVTAAHCVRNRRRKYKPEELWLVLGRENIKMWSNDGAQVIQAESTHIHPDYMTNTADADIAIVIMLEEAIFSNIIRPICMWGGDIDVRSIVKHKGMVVGWGKDEFGNIVTAEPKEVEFPIVSEEDCLWSNKAFREITSNRTFCAGDKNKSGPCNGDSGGGFIMKIDERWVLRGVVSMSLLRKEDGTCDLEQYVVFTDVAQFLGWVLSFID